MIIDINNPLLGLDFLNKFGQIIDYRNNTIYDNLTIKKRTLELSKSQVILVINQMNVN